MGQSTEQGGGCPESLVTRSQDVCLGLDTRGRSGPILRVVGGRAPGPWGCLVAPAPGHSVTSHPGAPTSPPQ